MNNKIKNCKFFMTTQTFFLNIPEQKKNIAKVKYNNLAFFRITIASILVLFLSIISIIRNTCIGFYYLPEQPNNFLNLYALIILLAISLFTIVMYYFFCKKDNKIIQNLVQVVYYIGLDIALILFFSSKFFINEMMSYEMFYCLVFSAIPFFDLRTNVINFFTFLIVFITDFILFFNESQYFFTNLIYLIALLSAFFYFTLYLRNYYLKDLISMFNNEILTEKLKRQSQYDSLTNCRNRYMLAETFENLIANSKDLSIIMIDVDNFKSYNDTFSHIAGDESLRKISNAMQQVADNVNGYLFRFGGEEFVFMSSNCSHERIKEIAIDILNSVRNLKINVSCDVKNTKSATISSGIVIMPFQKDIRLEDAISLADKQLYMAKNNGKDCAFMNNKNIEL